MLNEPPLRFPIHYNAPRGEHEHWSIEDAAGRELACPHTPPHPHLIDLLLSLNPPETQKESSSEQSDIGPVPTPAIGKRLAQAAKQVRPVDAVEAVEHMNTENLHIPAKTRDWMSRNHVSREHVAQIVETAPIQVDRDNPNIVHLHGDDYEVVAAPLDDVVLTVLPTPQGADVQPQTGRRANTGSRIVLTGEAGQFWELVAEHGFVTSPTSSGHVRITHPDSPGAQVFGPSTPSDARSCINAAMRLRKVFGIDIRYRPKE